MHSTDSDNLALFSLRIVSIDSYMKAPLYGLDTCYSEFRAEEVKQVPVIRIFGTDAKGTKTCAHIHGVFPYLYVPYGGGDSTGDTDRLAYQLASSLDKAINISLGQTNSTTQHVFKIVLVKAIPFYGYHKTEHKFLKIFFYNPAFIRRAANLLQNGAILGQIFQPHESHVPFILQFMIDYNLYGMSFLYVPNKTVRYRQQTSNECLINDLFDSSAQHDEVLKNIEQNQILDRKIERMSTSKQEIDINAVVILNRLQVSMNDEDNEHANPGIAFLWRDERGRRSKMQDNAPPLVVTQEPSQDRGLIPPTDSELFHQTALNRRLEQIPADSPSTPSSDSSRIFDQTLNRTNVHKKFNLNSFLQNSVYPTECTLSEAKKSSNQSILDASFLIDHMRTSKPTSNRPSNDSSTIQTQHQFDPNETFVDEELILNLTQRTSNTTLLNETLNENEHEVLNIFEELEEDEPSHDDTLRIDDDSVLAPFSQRPKESQHLGQSKQNGAPDDFVSFEEDDSDDDLLNQFSMSIIDCQPDEPQVNDMKIPQFDGVADSPTKSALKKSSVGTNVRSPSRSAKKYAPLDIVIGKSPAIQNDKSLIDQTKFRLKFPKLCLEKCDASKSVLSKTFTVSKEQSHTIDSEDNVQRTSNDPKPESESTTQNEAINNDSNTIKISEKYKDILKKSLVVKLIRYDNIEAVFNDPDTMRKFNTRSRTSAKKEVKMDKSQAVENGIHNDGEGEDDDDDIIERTPERILSPAHQDTERRYPKRNRKPRTGLQIYHTDPIAKEPKKLQRNKDELDKLDALYSWYNWSKCKLAERYDKERNFFPQPGPSNLNYYENDNLTGYYRPIKEIKSANKAQSNGKGNKRTVDSSEKRSLRKPKERKISETNDYSPIVKEVYSPARSDDSEWENDIHVQSFYEQSFIIKNSPAATQKSPAADDVIADDDDAGISPISNGFNSNERSNKKHNISISNVSVATPILSKLMENLKNSSSETKNGRKMNGTDVCTIKPVEDTPSYNDIEQALNSHKLPKVVHSVPYYSDPNDIVDAKKEVGHTVLQLTGNAVNDCDEFKSELNVNGMSKWQHIIAMQPSRGSNRVRDNKTLENTNAIQKKLARERRIRIEPCEKPPEHSIAVQWLKMREQTNHKKRTSSQYGDTNGFTHQNDENPAKIRCEISTRSKTFNQNNNGQQLPHGKSNGLNNNLVNELLAKKELTVTRITRRGTEKIMKSQTNTETKVQIIDDDSDDDVICLDDSLPTNHSNVNSFSQLDKKLENSEFRAHLNLEDTIARLSTSDTSFGIRGGPMENSFGFRMNLENFQCAKSNIEHNYLTILSLEIHCQTRSTLQPDPACDEIVCIFYELHNDVPSKLETDDTYLAQQAAGVLINTKHQPDIGNFRLATQTSITLVNSESELLMELVNLIRKWDPDIFAGYEIEMGSWGFVIQRSQAINFDLVPLISRIPSQKVAKFQHNDDENTQHNEFIGFEYDSEYKLHGRILLDVWRLLRGEIALTSYSFENIMYHVMHRRCPLYSHEKLTQLWNESINRWIVIEYYLTRVTGTLEILNQLDLVGRTCELAKLFGIQFYEVLSRGSQFRVESMMLRIAKPKNLIPISPSVQQRAHMRAPEYLPLILEPHSRFYSDPLIVLDFQSLYPSVIIAYNYCFSTCLGRVEHLGQSHPFEMGAWQLRIPRHLLDKLNSKKLIHISPCGAVFVKSSVREGVLPRMLREILDTRLMVKQSMKLHKSDKLLQRILHSRQLGLKLMANVTYGYTAANFSGRMPCVEVGDSVVSKGRETLERAIKTVESNKQWDCRVVYGDTDSLFVLVPGRSREEAFQIGAEIAETVTKQNPFPVRLKLEKVYHPSILQTKKRYVGYMYESADQSEATYEAKGIETVRRDGCPAVAKVLEKTLRILFETCDVSAVKGYICKQFTKILSGRTNIQDLVFAKEFRGVNGYKPGACVPALELTRSALLVDRRAEPRRGERVPYLVINGPPGVPLIRLVRSPHEYLSNEALKINAIYYITKVLIPPLNRCLLLIGADANQWFADLPRKSQFLLSLDVASNIINYSNQNTALSMDKSLTMGISSGPSAATKKSTISQYFSTTNCVCDCGEHTQNAICSGCLEPRRMQQSSIILTDKCMQLERQLNLCLEMCAACCGQVIDTKCKSLDCSVLFMLNRWKRESKQIHFYRQLICKHF